MKKLILIFISHCILFGYLYPAEKKSLKVKRPMVSLGLFTAGGYSLNTALHSSFAEISGAGRNGKNSGAASSPGGFFYGGGFSIRHFFDYYKPLSFLGIEAGARYIRLEGAKTGFLENGDPAVSHIYEYNNRNSLNIDAQLLMRVAHTRKFIFYFSGGIILAKETFNFEKITPLLSETTTLEAQTLGFSGAFTFEFALMKHINLFSSLGFQVVNFSDIKGGGKVFARKEPLEIANEKVKIFQAVPESAKPYDTAAWDQTGLELRFGAYFYL